LCLLSSSLVFLLHLFFCLSIIFVSISSPFVFIFPHLAQRYFNFYSICLSVCLSSSLVFLLHLCLYSLIFLIWYFFSICLSVCLSFSLVFHLYLCMFHHASSSVFLSAYHLWVFLVQLCVYSLIYLSFCLFISSSTYIFLYVNSFHLIQSFLMKQFFLFSGPFCCVGLKSSSVSGMIRLG
jgi:hypothetical protein